MKTFIRTFGCRANQYDSEAVRGLILASGGKIVDRPEDADFAVFNSCAVTAEAEADLRQGVRKAARRNPAIRSVIMGCAAALPDSARPSPLRELPGVEAIVGGADTVAIAVALGIPASNFSFSQHQSGARGLLRIQDGCDAHCTFCATTLARGENRSRGIDALIAESLALSERHSEIVITGTHIGTYGADCGGSLGELVRILLRDVPGVRFRLSSIEATEVDEVLLSCFATAARLTPYLHAPLQSGSDRTLRRMGRNWYDAESYEMRIREIVGDRKIFGLGADVIAGFPGETDKDHSATMRLVERLPFTSLHIFPFSARPGTAAERLGGRVDPQVVTARAAELRQLASEKSIAYRESRIGGRAEVVVTGGPGNPRGDARSGLTEDYLSVRVGEPGIARGQCFTARLRRDDHEICAFLDTDTD